MTKRFFFVFIPLLLWGQQKLFSDKIGLLIVATGRYDSFVEPLIHSARTFFCSGHEVTYYVFSDGVIPQGKDIVHIYQKRLGWPYDTLMRNAIYLENFNNGLFAQEKYLFALDADMRFVDVVGDEILRRKVAVVHPGYVTTGTKPRYESNPNSSAYVPLEKRPLLYYAGGFFGGTKQSFFHILTKTTKWVQEDLAKGIIAIWHDESHWNRYCSEFPPTLALSPSYCYADLAEIGFSGELAEEFFAQFPPKLCALTKDNKTELRQ